MKNSLFVLLLAIILTAGCKKGPDVAASAIVGDWKLERMDVDTTNENLDKMTFQEAMALMLAKMNEGKIKASFSEKRAVMVVDGDSKGDTMAYSLRHVNGNSYRMVLSRADRNEELELDVEKDRMRMQMKGVTYNFTRLP